MYMIILKSKKMIKKIIAIFIICLAVVLFLAVSKKLNIFFAKKYPLRGIDVSHYQSEIDWQMLKKQEIEFVYIKATEGSSYVDKKFKKNWKGVQSAGITAGAYHFFSFDSSALSQAKNFIKTVGNLSGKLVPMVDVEYYADKENNSPDEKYVVAQLQEFLDILEEKYGKKPIIYTTYKVYHKYIQKEFGQYPLWIRNVYYPPSDIDRKWQFWQYSDIGNIKGIKGDVDLNVFYGTMEEFEQFIYSGK